MREKKRSMDAETTYRPTPGRGIEDWWWRMKEIDGIKEMKAMREVIAYILKISDGKAERAEAGMKKFRFGIYMAKSKKGDAMNCQKNDRKTVKRSRLQ